MWFLGHLGRNWSWLKSKPIFFNRGDFMYHKHRWTVWIATKQSNAIHNKHFCHNAFRMSQFTIFNVTLRYWNNVQRIVSLIPSTLDHVSDVLGKLSNLKKVLSDMCDIIATFILGVVHEWRHANWIIFDIPSPPPSSCFSLLWL